MQSLRKISVPQNGIRKEGMVALFRNLINNPELQIIEVNDNYLNDPEAYDSLSACIENMNFLAVINIGDCMIGDNGAIRVLNALKTTSPHLLELHLQYNELSGNKVCDELIELVLIRNNLEKIRLQGNEFNKNLKNKFKEIVEKSEKDIAVSFYSSGEEEEEEEDEEEEEKNIEGEENLVKVVNEMSLKDD